MFHGLNGQLLPHRLSQKFPPGTALHAQAPFASANIFVVLPGVGLPAFADLKPQGAVVMVVPSPPAQS